MSNKIIFAGEQLPVYVTPSNTIKYLSSSALTGHNLIWQPQNGKSIYLTAVNISSLISLNVTLEHGASFTDFLTTGFNALAPVPFYSSYLSPIKFSKNESLYVSATVSGLVSISLFGYEQ